LIISWAEHWVRFILDRYEGLIESFEMIEDNFDIIFGKNFGYVISGALDVGERK